MKEELLRIENGSLDWGGLHLGMELEIARGECIGIFSDNLLNIDSLIRFFRGELALTDGRGYLYGGRIELKKVEKEVSCRTAILERQNHFAYELTARDYLIALQGKSRRQDRKVQIRRLTSPEAGKIRDCLEIDFSWDVRLVSLTLLSFCRLFLFKSWFYQYDILVLRSVTEMLRENDIQTLIGYMGHFLQRGMAFFMIDQEADFLFSCTNRTDIITNGSVKYRLYPEQYDEEILNQILKGKEERRRPVYAKDSEEYTKGENAEPVLEFEGVRTERIGEELSFRIHKGEIGLLLDRNYKTARILQRLFLDGERWIQGSVWLDGKQCRPGALPALLGKEVGFQMETPHQKERTLFYNLSGLENLSNMLIPKSGHRLMRRKVEKHIMHVSSEWFEPELLKKRVSRWSPQDRLRLTYYKWYLVNPKVLICIFPLTGADYRMQPMIIDMITSCAAKGIGVLVVSTDIGGIYEKIQDKNFINKLRKLN